MVEVEQGLPSFEVAAAELKRRRMDPLRIYEPQPLQQQFHECRASRRILRGGVRSGKSLATHIELSRAALGRDPFGKYPTDRALTIWIICWQEDNIGRTTFRLLFRAGAFRMIQDRKTALWRTWRRYDPDDLAREREAKPSLPLIPPRFAPLENFGWRSKKDRLFTSVELLYPAGHPMTGTRIHAFSSASNPPMGDPVDLILIDEDIQAGPWFLSELESRLIDNKGRLIWSVFPHTQSRALLRLSSQARKELVSDDPFVAEFVLKMHDNRHLDQEQVEKTLRGWSKEERRARDLGEFLIDTILMYPEFSPDIYGAPKPQTDPTRTKLDELLESGEIPNNSTKYLFVDPGHTTAAGLLVFVPPPQYGDHIVAFDEIYLHNCNAAMFAEAVAAKSAGHWFRAFYIDRHGSQPHEAGTGKTIRQQYAEELSKRNVVSELSGSNFIFGSTDIPGRTTAVHDILTIRPDGTTKFRYMAGRLPNMEDEFGLYKKRMGGGEIKEEPVANDNHLMNCLEYAAHARLRYYPPQRPERDIPMIVREFRSWMEARDKAHPKRPTIFLGPGRCL